MALTLLCDCIERRIVLSGLDQAGIQDRLGERPLSGQFWFFAYEALRRDWVDRYLFAQDPLYDFFQQLESAGVSFFDPNALPSALEGKEEEEWEDTDAIEDIAGEYETDDGELEDMSDF